MERKNKIIFSVIGLTILYLFTMSYFYFDYSDSLNLYNDEIYEGFDTLQNLIHKVHNEDSILYKTLLSKEVYISEIGGEDIGFQRNHTFNIIDEFLNLKGNKLFSSERIASTIDEYYSLENLRERIIEFHRLNILSDSDIYNFQISELLTEYEKQINIILKDIHTEIEFNKVKNENFINSLEKEFIVKEVILFTIFIVGLALVLYLSNSFRYFNSESKKELSILDSDMQRIVSYIKKEVSQGNFPTIKELKFHLKISHPTLLLKLNELEKNNLISIKKKGRNKHLFLK
jgi:hypothetical protein